MVEEAKSYPTAQVQFLTLTYDTDHVPITKNGFMTLNPRDLQLFVKRWRKQFGAKLKFYGVGEYGTLNKRPHYHLITYGAQATVADIQKLWPFGRISVDDTNNGSIGYVCGYVMKGRIIPEHRNDDRVREFNRMSKGLGLSYLTSEIVRYHLSDVEHLFVTSGDRKMSIPRYYRKKMEVPDDFAEAYIGYIQGKQEKAEYQRWIDSGSPPLPLYAEMKRDAKRVAVSDHKLKQREKRNKV